MHNLFFVLNQIINLSFIYLFFIVLLLIYIAYLHYKLAKNNIYYKSLIKRILKIDKHGNNADLKKILNKIALFDFKSLLPKDKILDENILNFIYEDEKQAMLFVHYTKDEKTAHKIIAEGFQFRESFYKTAENIYKDNVDFVNKHMRHKQFGKFILVIAISNTIYKYYSTEINKIKNSDSLVEQIFTEKEVVLDENDDRIYILPTQYLKGFINYEKGEIVKNPDFNLNYDSEMFKVNLNRLQNKDK